MKKITKMLITSLIAIALGVTSVVYIASAGGITLSAAPDSAENGISLSWTAVSDDTSWLYSVQRKPAGSQDWETVPLKDGFDNIKVLNIYPNAGEPVEFAIYGGDKYTMPQAGLLKEWMESPNSAAKKGYGKGIISVDPVPMTDFNAAPDSYLKDEDGLWKYDVLVFGFWDNMNLETLNGDSVNAVRKFIETGGGVIAGPGFFMGDDALPEDDEAYAAYYDAVMANNNTLRELFNIKLPNMDSGLSGIPKSAWTTESSEVTMLQDGLVINSLWDLGNAGDQLSIQTVSGAGIVSYGKVWVKKNIANKTDKDGKGATNAYLSVWNNTAVILAGENEGRLTADEKKLIANTIFCMKQRTGETEFFDYGATDDAAPLPPIVQTSLDENGAVVVKVDSIDRGTAYSHRVQASSKNGNVVISSETESVITSGIKGYSIVVNGKASTEPGPKINSADGVYNSGYIPENGEYYVHVKAYDNAGNATKTVHVDKHMRFAVAGAGDGGKAELSWKEPVKGYDWTYEVEKKTKAGVWEKIGDSETPAFTDESTPDTAPPETPAVKFERLPDGSLDLSISCQDNGTPYTYRVIATCTAGIITSDEVTLEVKSGIKGYSVEVDREPLTDADDIPETADGAYTPAYNPGRRESYIHIRAIDEAGNASETGHCYVPADSSVPIKIAAEVSLASNFKINPNARKPEDRLDPGILSITSHSNGTVNVYCDGIIAGEGCPAIVDPNKFTDKEWQALGARDTSSNIAIGLKGVPTGDFWFKPEGQQERILLGQLEPEETMNLTYQVKFGLSWPYGVNLQYHIAISLEDAEHTE